MSEFLVEVYASPSAARALPEPEDVSEVAAQLTSQGRPVRLLASIFVPEDETHFYLFEGSSGEVVREAAMRSGLHLARLAEAVSDWGSKTWSVA
jgi:hypothetical protein